MSEAISRVGMTLSRPGEFIREEILAELGLSIARAAEFLGVRRATLPDLVNAKAALSPEMALPDREGVRRLDGHALRMQAWHDSHPCASAPARST